MWFTRSPLWVVGFFWVHSVAPYGSQGTFGVHSSAHCGSWDSLAFVGFFQKRLQGRLLHFGSLGALGRAQGHVGFLRVNPRVHSGSLGSFVCTLGVVGFIRVHWVCSCATWVSFRLNLAHHGCCWVAYSVSCGAVVFIWAHRVFGGFIGVGWVYSGAPRETSC